MTAGESIDVAWARAEATLGEYWYIRSLTRLRWDRWEAVASDGQRIRTAIGIDPADAILALSRQTAMRGAAVKIGEAMG